MSWKVLLVELETQDYCDTWSQTFASQEYTNVEFLYAAGADEAKALIDQGNVFCLVCIAMDQSNDLTEIILHYQNAMGPLPENHVIICDEPSPYFIAAVYEFGVEQFMMHQFAKDELSALIPKLFETVNNLNSPESKIIALQRAIKQNKQDQVKDALLALGDLPNYDYRATFVQGKAAEMSGDMEFAMKTYRTASSMNKMFRPPMTSLGEDLLLVGQLDEALMIFEKLDRTNPNDIERKTQIASAYVEKNNIAMAQKHCDAIAAIDAESPKILEINAQILLTQGKLGEAFKLMDNMENVGPFFAAKLNDLGIKLSQSGRVKNALALYQKAHKIVRPELRYKISMNAALACRKMLDYDLAIKYAARCEKEYGSAFPKLLKIKQTLQEERAQRKAQPPAEKKVG